MSITWSAIDVVHVDDADAHWRAATALGLSCPFDIFEQLFHDHHRDQDFAAEIGMVDWSRVQWEEAELSGVKWRQVAVPRGYQYAVDEARARTALEGLVDEREEVVASWRDIGTWMRAPVLVTGEVTRSLFEYELLVGFTRLGDLLGLLDRGEVAEWSVHRAWVGSLRDT